MHSPTRAVLLGSMTDPADDRRIQSIERPDKALMLYYFLTSVIILPAFPILIIVMYFRYHTMRYKFSDDGISMRWGILFPREIIVNYSRIQDIHLRSNIVERWLGLARILIQTASGNKSAELTIEGIKDFELLRDFLYSRMRGVKDHHAPTNTPSLTAAANDTSSYELTTALREVTLELRAVREAIEKRGTTLSEDSRHV